jgi:DNA-binding NarL/FixJ family response regulator
LAEKGGVIRIVIVDDHPIVRDGLRKLLDGEPGFSVVGHGADGPEALELVKQQRPDILLLDLSMPQMPGLEVLRALHTDPNGPRAIILTAAIEQAEVFEAVRLGARGVVLKEVATEVLFHAIRCVMRGEYWLGRDGLANLIESLRARIVPSTGETEPEPIKLTPREKDIIAAVVTGLTNRVIAQKYSVSEQTVKHHLSNIFEKLGVSSRLELALFAVENRLVARD